MKKILLIFCILLFFSRPVFPTEIDFSKIAGWRAADSVARYDGSNLWEYINGAADLFISYDFQESYSCEIFSGENEAVVDVYNMQTCLNAFGVYKSERGDVSPRLAIGTEAVITSPIQCLLLKDMYYVKVTVYEGELPETRAKQLLKSISAILPGKSTFPDEFNLLPTEGKIAGTENFVKEGYLGLADLKNAVCADFSDNSESKFQYFLLIPREENAQKIIWEKLTAKWKSLENIKYQILYKKIPYKGLIGLIKTDKGIFGVTDSANEAQMVERLENITKQ